MEVCANEKEDDQSKIISKWVRNATFIAGLLILLIKTVNKQQFAGIEILSY